MHADAVWETLQRLEAHEQVIDDELKRGENKTDREWQAGHKALVSQHARTADIHERIKRHRQEVVAEIGRMLKQSRRGV